MEVAGRGGALRDPVGRGGAWRDLVEVDAAAVNAVAVACGLCFPYLKRGSVDRLEELKTLI